MDKMSKLLDTIRNLRKKAADASTTEAEALAAIEMADRLMQKNGVTLDDLKEASTKGGITTGTWGGTTATLHPVQYTVSAIARLTETRGWLGYNGDKQNLNFIGFEADVEYALYLVDLIHNAMEGEWESFRESIDYALIPRNQRGRARTDFMRAMANRLRQRMNDMAAARATTSEGMVQSNALVVAKRSMVADALAKSVGELRTIKTRKKKYLASAYDAGRAAGDRTTITTGVRAA